MIRGRGGGEGKSSSTDKWFGHVTWLQVDQLA